jgi:DNA polymerase-3 subunit gamma/tau
VRRLGDAPAPPPGGGAQARASASGSSASASASGAATAVAAAMPVQAPAEALAQAGPLARYARFEDVVALIRARRDVSLLVEVETGVRLVRYAPGRIEFEPAETAPPDLAARLAQRLQLWTGARWGVAVVGSGGGASIAEVRAKEKGDLVARSLENPMVQAVLAAFPGAEIREVRPADALAAATPETAAGEDEDGDWDPFLSED